MSDYTTTNTTSLTLEKFNTEPVMTIHPDGRVTVSDKFQPDEAAAKVVEAFKTRWMADPQATKIRELQSDVNELKELVEYLRDKIKRLEEARTKAAANSLSNMISYEAAINKIEILQEAGDGLAKMVERDYATTGFTEPWRKAKGIKL